MWGQNQSKQVVQDCRSCSFRQQRTKREVAASSELIRHYRSKRNFWNRFRKESILRCRQRIPNSSCWKRRDRLLFPQLSLLIIQKHLVVFKLQQLHSRQLDTFLLEHQCTSQRRRVHSQSWCTVDCIYQLLVARLERFVWIFLQPERLYCSILLRIENEEKGILVFVELHHRRCRFCQRL